MKLDKKATKILLGCIICTIIVGLLLLVAFRFASLSCELIKVDPQALRHSQLKAFNKESNKPTRSHDKTMLIKIAAYLDYNIPSASSKSAASSSTSTTTTPMPSSHTNNNNNNNNGNGSSSSNNSTSQQSGARSANPMGGQQVGGPIPAGASRPSAQGPSPSVPQVGFTTGQLHNQSFVTSSPNQLANRQPATGGAGWQSSSSSSPSSGQWNSENRVEKRFLPLELDEIETKRLDDNKFKYKLIFNCSTLNMVFVRSPQRVHVESMSLELEPSSRHKSKCDLKLPPPQLLNGSVMLGLFAADARDGYAHYQSKASASFRCYHLSGRQSKEMMGQPNGPLLLADLHILALEFETITGSISNAHVKKDSFKIDPTTTSAATSTSTNTSPSNQMNANGQHVFSNQPVSS